MKYLLVLVVVFVGVWMWRNNRIAATQNKEQQQARATKRQESQQIMVSCAHCGLHLLQTEALPGPGGVAEQWFCSSEHRKLGVKAG
jgi:uncharacterized protein